MSPVKRDNGELYQTVIVVYCSRGGYDRDLLFYEALRMFTR